MRISLPPTIQVSDCLTGSIAASSVFQAFDYALRMGAHVVSCSFGASYAYGFAPTAPAPSYHAQWTAAYVAALQPLASKVGVRSSKGGGLMVTTLQVLAGKVGGHSRGEALVRAGQSVMAQRCLPGHGLVMARRRLVMAWRLLVMARRHLVMAWSWPGGSWSWPGGSWSWPGHGPEAVVRKGFCSLGGILYPEPGCCKPWA